MNSVERSYRCLNEQVFKEGAYAIVPIRDEDKYIIMKWRNEQIYHLRQAEVLSKEKQDAYFKHVISDLFHQEKPSQILFSYLKDNQCIGYGGLVHINWIDKNAEISFIMDTSLEEEEFQLHWKNFLDLLHSVAFEELNFHKIFTYAFDLRPHLYEALEIARFEREAILSEHCLFNGNFIDVHLHRKFNPYLSYRLFTKLDKSFIFELNNDPESRRNSFNRNKITMKEHEVWFNNRLLDENSIFYICESKDKAIGIVRFQKNEFYTTIGINIVKSERSKGLAKTFLKKTCKLYFEKNSLPIHAFIQEENVASIKTFKKAGFLFKENTEIGNIKSLVYKLEKNG